MRAALVVGVAIFLGQAGLLAQTTGRGAARAQTAPRQTSVRVAVRDPGAGNLDDVRVTLSGDGSGEFTTAAAGIVIMPNLKDGTYRIRCEKEGFVTLEREFAVKGGAPTVIELVLTPQPPPPPPPPKPMPPPAAAVAASGPAVSVTIADFVDKNFIGREPMKESILACKPLETVRLLQMRESIAAHAHADVDELVYVVAGEGTARIGDQSVALSPSTLLVVPHATPHQFERRGKNPLIMLSALTGAACQESASSK